MGHDRKVVVAIQNATERLKIPYLARNGLEIVRRAVVAFQRSGISAFDDLLKALDSCIYDRKLKRRELKNKYRPEVKQ